MEAFSIAIIIANYNKEKYIEEAIKSVLVQSYPVDEIIVVDDKSTDNSRNIIKKYEHMYSNIKGIYFDKNQGVSCARNAGVKVAKTNFVSFLDADDIYFNKDKILNEINLLKEKSDRKVPIVSYSKTYFMSEDGERQVKKECDNSIMMNGKIFKPLMLGLHFDRVPRDYIISKSFFLMNKGFDERMNLYEDYDLLCRLALKGEFYCTNELGTGYRQSVGGLSSQNWQRHKLVRKRIFEKYLKEIPFVKRLDLKIESFILYYANAIKRRVIKNS